MRPPRTAQRIWLSRRTVMLSIALVVILGLGFLVWRFANPNNSSLNSESNSHSAAEFGSLNIPLNGLSQSGQISFDSSRSLNVNGQLKVNNGFVIAPTDQPTSGVAGQMYYDRSTNQLNYYNGNGFVSLNGNPQTVTSINGTSGSFTLGGGLSLNGSQLSSTGVVSITSASANLAVANDGNGNVTLSSTGVDGQSGTAGHIALFTGSQTIGNSILSQSGTTVSIAGAASIDGSATIGGTLSLQQSGQSTINLTETGSGVTGQIYNDGNLHITGGSNNLWLDAGGSGTVFINAATSNPVAINEATIPAYPLEVNGDINITAGHSYRIGGTVICTSAGCSGGGGGGGVSSLNGLTGALTVANATASGSTITVDDASTTQKGIAQFNSTNFTVVNGNVNTIQDINAAAAPTFGQLNLTSSQASATMLTINNTNGSAVGNLIDLKLNGTSEFRVSPAGDLIMNGTINGQTISSAANFTGTLGVTGNISTSAALSANSAAITTNLNVSGTTSTGAASITNDAGVGGNLTVSGVTSTNTITPTGAFTVGSGSIAFTLQGNASSSITATGGGFTTAVGFTGTPTGAVNYNFDRSAATGTYTICTTVGNCAGSGSGVTTPGGTAGKIAKFTAGQAIGDSIISDNGTTVTIGGVLAVNTLTPTSALTLGATAQNATLQGATIAITSTAAGVTNTLTFATPSSGNKTITLPNATGTVCLDSGNCLGGGGGGANTALSNLTGVALNTTLLPGSAGAVDLGSGTSPFGKLFLSGTSATPATNNFQITGVSTGGTRVITLPDATGTVCLQASASCGFATSTGSTGYIQNGTSQQTANFNIISAAAGSIGARIEGAANNSAQVLLVRSGSNPTNNTFEVQNSSGQQLFAVDTANSRVVVGSGGSCAVGRFCVGQSTTGSASGTSTNSYNLQTVTVTGSGASFIDQNLVVNDTSTGIANTIKPLVVDTSGTTNTSATINSIYAKTPSNAAGNFLAFDNGATNVLNVSNLGAVTLRTSTNSTSAFQVKNASGAQVINFDTTNDGSALFGPDTLGKHVSINVGTNNGSIDIGATGGNLHLTLTQNANGTAQISHDADLVFKRTTNSATDFQVQNASNQQVFAVDTSNGAAILGQSSALNGSLVFNSAATTNTTTIAAATPTAARTITLPDATGTVCLQNSASCGFALTSGSGSYIQNQNSTDQTADLRISGTARANTAVQSPSLDTASAAALTIGGVNASSLGIGHSGISTTITGNLIQNTGTFSLTGSSTSSISTASGTLTLQSVDANNNIVINGGSNSMTLNTGTSGTITVGSSNTTTVNLGAQTNNTRTVNVGYSSATNAQTVNIGAPASTGQTSVYAGSNGILLSSTGSTIVKQSGTATAAAFQVQNVAGTSTYFDVDALNGRVGIGTNAPSAQLDVIGQLPTSSVGSAFVSSSPAYEVETQGKYAYTADYGKLETWDITRPSNPVSLGTVSFTGGISHLKVSGNYVFAWNTTWSELYIIDVSNPKAPSKLKTITSITNLSDVAVQGRYMYVATTDSNGDILVYDIINPANPVLKSTLSQSPRSSDYLTAQGNYLYVTENNGLTNYLQVIDISNPVSPVTKGIVTVTANGQPRAVGRYVYIAGGTTLQAVNVADPTTPASVGTITTHSSGAGLDVQGRYAYVAIDATHELQVFNVSNPASMSLVGTVSLGTETRHVAVQGRYAYLTDYTNGKLLVYDMGGEYAQQLEAGGILTGNLDVTGPLRVTGTADLNNGLRLSGGADINGNVAVQGSQSTQANAVDAFAVQNTSGNSVVDVDTINQRLGINTSAPTSLLQVNQSTLAPGTVTNSASSTAVTGTSTTFLSTFQPGDTFTITSTSNTCTIAQITSDTALVCTTALAGAATGSAYSFTQQVRLSVTNAGVTNHAGVLAVTNPAVPNLFTVKTSASTGNLQFGANVIGKAAAGDTVDHNGGFIQATQFNSGTGGTISTLRVYLGAVDSLSPHVKVALYSDSSGSPGSLLSSASAASITATANAWNTAPLGTTVTLTPNTNYWLALTTESGNTFFSIHSGGGSTKYQSGFTYSGNFPSTYTTNASSSDVMSIYGAYSSIIDTSATSVGIALNDNNEATFKPTSDSTTAFQLQRANGTSMLIADSLNDYVGVDNLAVNTAFDNNYRLNVKGDSKLYRNSSTGTDSILELYSDVGGAGTLQYKVTANGNVSQNGTLGIQTTTDSTSALNVTSSTGGSVLQVDTTNGGNVTLLGAGSGKFGSFNSSSTLSTSTYRAFSAAGNGYIYYIGGYDSSNALTTVSYAKVNANGSVGTWSTTTALPTGRSSGNAVVVNGYLYLIGGYDNTTGLPTNGVYYGKINSDGTISSWNSATNLPAADYRAGVTYANGYIYAVGGQNGSFTSQRTVYYGKVNGDGSISSWTTSANSLPTSNQRSLGTSVVANGYIYYMGGSDDSATKSTVYFASLNPSTGANGAWSAATNGLPTAVRDATSVVINGYVYVIGGNTSISDPGTPTRTIMFSKLDSTTGQPGSWASFSNSVPTALYGASSVTTNGYMYYMGGTANSNLAGSYTNAVSYASTDRVQIGGSLDLVGVQGASLNDSSGDNGSGGVGGSLTAGNGLFVGSLQVQGDATVKQNLSVDGNEGIAGELNAGSYSGGGLTSCSSTNSKLLWNSSTKQFSCGTDRASVTIRKASDESVTSSTAVQADNELTFSIGANETYIIHVNVNATFAAAGSIKYSVTAPSGATCNISSFGADSTGSAGEIMNGGCGTTGTYGGGGTASYETIDGTITTGATSGSVTLQWAQNSSNASATIVKAGSSLVAYKVSGADLAEAYYTKDGSIHSGDVVSLDPSASGGVAKASKAYDSKALGVISTQPGQVLANPDSGKATGRPVLVALSGRIPVNVSAQNGSIHAGDFLTASPTPGVAMKATRPGQVIGRALEDYDGTVGSQAQILMFASQQWADPRDPDGEALQSDVLQSASITNLTADTATIANLTVSKHAEFLGDLVVHGNTSVVSILVNGHIITGGGTPTTKTADGVCSDASVTVEGTDTAGLLTVTTPAGCTSSGDIANVTFSKAFDKAPRVTLTPANANASALKTYVDSDAITPSSFTLATPTAVDGSKTYRWYYQVLQ